MSGGSQHNPNGRQSQLGAGWSPLQLQVANLLARAPQAHMASERGVTWHTPTPPPHLYHVPAPSPPDPLQTMKTASSNSVFRHTATPPEIYRHTPTPPDKHLLRHTPSPGDVKAGAALPPADLYPHLGTNREKLVRAEELLAYARGGVDLTLSGPRGANGSPAPPGLSVRDAPTINSLIARAAPHARPAHARVDALLERLAAAPASPAPLPHPHAPPHSVIVHSRAAPSPSPPSSNEDSADSCGAPPGSKRKRKPERTVRVPAPAPPPEPERAPPPPAPHPHPEPRLAPPPTENGEHTENGVDNRAVDKPPSPTHARRKTRSGSAETIDDIAAMIAATERAEAEAPPEPEAAVTADKLESVLAGPQAPPRSPRLDVPLALDPPQPDHPAAPAPPRRTEAEAEAPPDPEAAVTADKLESVLAGPQAPPRSPRLDTPDPPVPDTPTAPTPSHSVMPTSPPRHARRKIRSGSAETIDDIAAMIAATDRAGPETAEPAPADTPDKLASVLAAPADKLANVLAAPVDKMASALANPDPPEVPHSKTPEPQEMEPPVTAAAPRRRSARTSNTDATNVPVESPSEAKAAEAEASEASSAEPTAASFVEVENQLEKMFAGLEEPAPDADKQTAKARKRRKSAPTKGERKGGKRSSRASLDGAPRRKVPRNKPADKKKTKDGPAKDAYDSGSNASSGRSRGPYIQIVGPRASPVSVCVVNAAAGGEDERRAADDWRNGLRARGLHASTLGLRYDATTPDASWLCAFCDRGPHHAGLGDLFGPYTADTDCEEYRALDEASRRRFETTSGGAEVWFHEACGVWAPGLVAAGARLWGLAAAAWGARAARCQPCGGPGAGLACAAPGCRARAHLPCARPARWLLHRDFRALCPRHA